MSPYRDQLLILALLKSLRSLYFVTMKSPADVCTVLATGTPSEESQGTISAPEKRCHPVRLNSVEWYPSSCGNQRIGNILLEAEGTVPCTWAVCERLIWLESSSGWG